MAIINRKPLFDVSVLNLLKFIIMVLAIMFVFSMSQAAAQTQSQVEARAYYFEAERSLGNGKPNEAYSHLRQAEGLLGESNALLSALEVKILFQLRKFREAKSALTRFHSYKPHSDLVRQMAPLLISINGEIEAADQARKEEAKNKELALIRDQKTVSIIKGAIDACLDETSCAISGAIVSGQLESLKSGELRTFADTSLITIQARSCRQYQSARGCYFVSRHTSISTSEQWAAADLSCTLGFSYSCYRMALKYSPDNKGNRRPGQVTLDARRALEYHKRACDLDDDPKVAVEPPSKFLGCSTVATMTRYNDPEWSYGIPKDMAVFRLYALKSCQESSKLGFTLNVVLQGFCKKNGFPKFQLRSEGF